MSVLLGLLIKEIGQPVAKKIWAVVSGNEYSEQLKRAIEAAGRGVPVLQAMQDAFGDTYFKIVNAAINDGPGPFTYEAGRNDYIKVTFPGNDKLSIVASLRTELNINLERISKLDIKDNPEIISYFKGIWSEWKKRYIDTLGISENEKKVFDSIDKLLDGRRRNAKQVYMILSRTMFGTVGALLIIKAVLIIMGIGLGVIMNIMIWINGLPFGTIASLILLGTILIALATIQFSNKHIMTTCVQIAYKLLDDK